VVVSDRWPVAGGLHPYKSMIFVIVRHGGRSADRYRLVRVTADEVLARELYQQGRELLRQGAVELWCSTGLLLARTSAPRLRTRW